VVRHHDQHVLVRTEGEEASSQRQPNGQVERPARLRRDQRGQVALRGLAHRQLEPGLAETQDVLVRLPVLGREHRAQHLVPIDHVPQRRSQGRAIQITGQP
jgi:hypothetical protein